MTLHLIKLCVGVSELDELRVWQRRRLGETGEVFHITRMVPKRRQELLDGGSPYWVVKGLIIVRQRIIDIVPFRDKEGVRRCKLVFDAELVETRPQPRRAFQGWRYFDPDDVPDDLPVGQGLEALPPEMRAELAALGLL